MVAVGLHLLWGLSMLLACSEALTWPNYPAQIGPFTYQVTSEGGCCGPIPQEHTGPLFSVGGQPLDGSPRARGFNIVAVDHRTGQVTRQGSFDTYLSVEATNRMVEFLRFAIPDDSVVMVAAYDAVHVACPAHRLFNTLCTEVLPRALQEIGGTRNTFGYRSSYALIGFKGNHCGRPSVVGHTVQEEAYAAYPGPNGRGGKQTEPVTVQATIHDLICH